MATPRKRAPRATTESGPRPTPPPVRRQVSAGGVCYRRRGATVEVALVSVGPTARWQLPKGIVDEGESPEVTAIRETREEAGVEAELVAPLETIEYWYQATEGGERVRFHKFVHFFLLEYRAGDVTEHDHEVNEARWFPLEEAAATLAFRNEKAILEKASGLLADH